MPYKSILKLQQLENGKGLPLPAYHSEEAAGFDLYAAIPQNEPIIIQPIKRALIPTGLIFALEKDYEAQIRPRSGLALKHGITVLNSPGTIDSDYRGEIKIILINLGEEPFIIERGMRIAQCVISPVIQVNFVETIDINKTTRGEGGFGSTGA